MLRVYDEIRRPRAQSVWNESVYAGEIFDGYGRTQPFPQGMAKDLPGLWDFVWGYGLNEGVRQAERRLQEQGVFTVGSVPQAQL